MAFNLKYHKLFEVRIFHAFELKSGDAFFNKSSQEQATELVNYNYDISKYLKIIPTDTCRKNLKNHRLIFKSSPFGFFVGIQTKPSETTIGALKPAIAISENTVFDFKIQSIHPDWSNITNLKLLPSINAKFHFSNHQHLEEKIFPSISVTPKLFNPNEAYEMGEIVVEEGTVLQARQNVKGTFSPSTPSLWEVIPDNSWITDRDRLLVPFKFNYHFNTNDGLGIQQVVFDLKTLDGQIKRTISINESIPFRNYAIDFHKKQVTDAVLETGSYLLEVNSTDGYSATHLLYITETLADRRDFGIISIAHKANLDKFKILEENGDLREVAGQTQPPIFEIKLKNRATYWQFIQHANDSYTLPAGDPKFSVDDSKILTKNPLPLSRFYVNHLLSNTSINMSNPTDYTLQLDSTKEKYISAIHLPKLNI